MNKKPSYQDDKRAPVDRHYLGSLPTPFDVAKAAPVGVHEKARVHPDARVAPDAKVAKGAVIERGAIISPNAYIGPNAVIHAEAEIGPGVTIGARSEVGNGSVVWGETTVHPDVTIGDNCKINGETSADSDTVISAHAVIGSDTEIDCALLHEYAKVGHHCEVYGGRCKPVMHAAAELGAYSRVADSTIGPRGVAGEAVRMDQHSIVCPGAEVGAGSRLDYEMRIRPGLHVVLTEKPISLADGDRDGLWQGPPADRGIPYYMRGDESGIDPSATVSPDAQVDPSASIGKDVVVAPGAKIEAGAVIGEGCRIGEGAIVSAGAALGRRVVLDARSTAGENVRIANDVSVGTDSIIMDTKRRLRSEARVGKHATRIGEHVRIGSGVVVHDNAELEEGVSVEDSVEIKSRVWVQQGAKIGRGSSLGAFSRVEAGAVLGERVITAEKTRIRQGARLGDDVLLEGNAPVSPGVDVPAGTRLTKALPRARVDPVRKSPDRADGSASPEKSAVREPQAPVVRGKGRPAGGAPPPAPADRDAGPRRA